MAHVHEIDYRRVRTHVCAHVYAHMSMHMSFHMSPHKSMRVPIQLSMRLSIHTAIHMYFYVPMHVSTHTAIHISVYLVCTHVGLHLVFREFPLDAQGWLQLQQSMHGNPVLEFSILLHSLVVALESGADLGIACRMLCAHTKAFQDTGGLAGGTTALQIEVVRAFVQWRRFLRATRRCVVF